MVDERTRAKLLLPLYNGIPDSIYQAPGRYESAVLLRVVATSRFHTSAQLLLLRTRLRSVAAAAATAATGTRI